MPEENKTVVVSMDDLEDDFEEEVSAKEDNKVKTKKHFDIKKFGKDAIKVGAGIVAGFGAAIIAGLAMSNKEPEEFDDVENYNEDYISNSNE